MRSFFFFVQYTKKLIPIIDMAKSLKNGPVIKKKGISENKIIGIV